MSEKANSRQSVRYPALDTLKFLLCIAIVFCHYRTGLLGGDNADINKLPFLPFFFEYGELAVEFFFIISGFLIANSNKEKIQGGRIEFAPFIKYRVKGILAPAMLAEIFAGVLYPLIRISFLQDVTFPSFYRWFTSLTLSAKGFIESNGVYPISSVTWYVDILVLDYCLYWLVCHLTKNREKLYVPLCVMVVFFGWICIQYIDFPLLWYANGRGYAGFFVGVLLCELQHNARVDHRRVAYAGLIAVLALALMCNQFGIQEVLENVRISFLFFMWPCLFLTVINIPWVKKIMEFPLLHKLSLWSEYIFFSHPIAISTMRFLNRQFSWGLSFYDGWNVLLVLAAVVVVAVLFRITLIPFKWFLRAGRKFFTSKVTGL